MIELFPLLLAPANMVIGASDSRVSPLNDLKLPKVHSVSMIPLQQKNMAFKLGHWQLISTVWLETEGSSPCCPSHMTKAM
jgi:hypothetical protein